MTRKNQIKNGGGNLTETISRVSSDERYACVHQLGCVLWLTGLSGSGKSTVAHAVERALIESGHPAYVLDGDNVRYRLNRDLGFSMDDRNENVRRVAEVARLFAESGIICLAAFISPSRMSRAEAKAIIGPERFIEVYISTDISVCEERDPKGLYSKARDGNVENFTGISSTYEPPGHPDLTLCTNSNSLDQSCGKLLDILVNRGFIEHPENQQAL